MWSLVLLLSQTLSSARPPEPPPRPNVLMIVLDDLGWRDLGCYGGEFYETPAIDRFATEAVRFTAAYSNGPNCAPSRASLMTGRVPPRHGIHTVQSASRGPTEARRLLVPKNRTTLEAEEWTLAEALAGAGYDCASMGKWHLGPTPATQGFSSNVGGNERGHPKSYFSPYENADLEDGPEGEHLTARLSQEAVEFLAAPREEPFFLYLSYFAVHTPVQGRPDLVRKYREKKGDSEERLPRPPYAAMVEAVDSGIGEVLGALERLGLAESTLVVLLSDNGGHGRQTSMLPLRGSKGMLYEGGIRVPMLLRWPGRVEAGVTSDLPIQGSDWFPTILEAAGITPPDRLQLDGASLLAPLAGEQDLSQRTLGWHFPAYLEAYAQGDGPWRTTPVGALRKGRYKLLEFFEDGRRELYDLEQDPGEEHDLAAAKPELVESLQGELDAWRARTGAVVPRERNPGFSAPPAER